MRSITIMLLSFLLFGCTNAEEKTVFIYDKNKKPVHDVYVVARESNITFPFVKNKRIILKSDSEGKVTIRQLKGLINIIAGKDGYYPSRAVIESRNNNIFTVILKDDYNESDYGVIIDILEEKTDKQIFKKNDSELWNEWIKYIKKLDMDGYFDDVKSEEWFIEEISG